MLLFNVLLLEVDEIRKIQLILDENERLREGKIQAEKMLQQFLTMEETEKEGLKNKIEDEDIFLKEKPKDEEMLDEDITAGLSEEDLEALRHFDEDEEDNE